MGIWKGIRRLLGQESARPVVPARPVAPPPRMEDDKPEPIVPEMTVADLKQVLANEYAPLVLDIREPYEWRQVRMPFAYHIPMNDVPDHVDEVRREAESRAQLPIPVVVVCAHGSRSYSVAAWLNEQGIAAASLDGGITQWSVQGGEVEQGA